MATDNPTDTKRFRLHQGSLRTRLKSRTEHALACGALQSLSTYAEVVEQDGIPFLVRRLANLARKASSQRTVKPTHNPFLPYEEDLYVGDVSATHIALLNKFNVVDSHLLVVTRTFEEQQTPLNQMDFEALWYCLMEYEGLGFYNAGQIAGASQRHKHLQVVPLPLTQQGPRLPLEVRLLEDAEQKSYSLPYQYRWVRLPEMHDPQQAAAVTLSHYLEILREFGLMRGPASATTITGAYNLLVTREWLLLVPRTQETIASISINALAYAGALLVKNDQQLAVLKAQGPLNIISQAACSTRPA